MREYSIDLYAELEAIGIEWVYDSETWIKVLCPFHDDSSPSCGVHTQDYHYNCLSCGAAGPIEQLIARRSNRPIYVIDEYLREKYASTEATKPISIDLVEKYHRQIWAAHPLLVQLRNRGVTDRAIRAARLGENKGRITIPVFNTNQSCVNVISYAPGAKDRKFVNARGRGKPIRIYRPEQLKYKNRIVFGGPLKALAAEHELNAAGFGAIANTGGENAKSWDSELLDALAADCDWLGICLDIDATGVSEAQGLAMRMYSRLSVKGVSIYVIKLPLDPVDFPKGDINDWIALGKPILPLLEDVEPWEPPRRQAATSSTPPKSATIYDATKAEFATKRLEFRGLVSAVDQDPYYLPHKVCVNCDRRATLCDICPIAVMPSNPPPIIEIDPESDCLLEMMQNKRNVQHDCIRKSLEIPPCKRVTFDVLEYYDVQSAIITQEIDIRATGEDVNLHTVTVGCKLEVNETYSLTGQVVPHPNTQKATALVSRHKSVADTLSCFTENKTQLEKFQPTDWTSAAIWRKLDEIYYEIENKVTHIWGRRDLHILYDLAYHSALYINAEGRTEKGYVEVLAVGDTACGKSTVAENLQLHYGLGKIVDMGNASVAGLLGGIQQMSNRNWVSWGEFVRNDRRLLVLEELRDARSDVLAHLTDMRSRGIANVTKIEQRKAQARVRLIAISNTLSGSNVSAYAYGTDVIRELIPQLEDVRRFDAFNIVSSTEVDARTMNMQHLISTDTPTEYDADSCRNLVLWGWTRQPEQIKFENWKYVIGQAVKLADTFSDAVPLLDKGGARFKIARLATALAVRTFSNDGKGSVIVRNCHVDCIIEYLIRCYSTTAFGYDRFSAMVKDHTELKNPITLTNKILELDYPLDFIDCALRAHDIELRDICDWTNKDRQDATEFVSLLVRNHAMTRKGRWYHKSAAFIELLKELRKTAKETNVAPNYVKESL